MKSYYSAKDCIFTLLEHGTVFVSMGENLLEDDIVDALIALKTSPSLEPELLDTAFEIVKAKPQKSKELK